MAIRLENVGVAVRDLEATIAFFTDLGLTVVGRDTVSGSWTDTAVGLDGNHANIAMLETPDGAGRLELVEYIHPEAIETTPTRPNEIGMHRIAFSVDDLDAALESAYTSFTTEDFFERRSLLEALTSEFASPEPRARRDAHGPT